MSVRKWDGGRIALVCASGLLVAWAGIALGAELDAVGREAAGLIVAVAVPMASFLGAMAVTWWWLGARGGEW